MLCKVCGDKTNNGTNFCSRKHRLQWKRVHQIPSKRLIAMREAEMMSYGSNFNNGTGCQNQERY